MFTLDGTVQTTLALTDVSGIEVRNAHSTQVPVRGGSFVVTSIAHDVVVQAGEPMIPARWDELEAMVASHFERYDSVMSRLA